MSPSPQNGVLLRTVLDQVTGDLSDTRTRYIGSRPVKLFRVRMQNNEAVSLAAKPRVRSPGWCVLFVHLMGYSWIVCFV